MLTSTGIGVASAPMVVPSHVRHHTPGCHRGNFVRGWLWHAIRRLAETSYAIPQVEALCAPLQIVGASTVPDPSSRWKCRTDAEGCIKRPSWRLILAGLSGPALARP